MLKSKVTNAIHYQLTTLFARRIVRCLMFCFNCVFVDGSKLPEKID